ncbi:hypothetical protein BCR44DRAFT_1444725 [Catenaria anguillulae PL171]|uniref:Uncharacterized protein n=1 Tax=Catenaria anguillulae PL171 TaxID=765915 RepID=A0A1Y2H7H1_9FUNG|nr:hypothetical protein BCR44DRAFT_1444725 [Catenaria anguillulae PL171]
MSPSSRPIIQAGEIVVKTHGETTLRYPVAKYRHHARGILPKELERDFGGLEDAEHQLARYVLTKCMGQTITANALDADSIRTALAHVHEFRPAQLAEIKRHSSLESANVTLTEPIHARLAPYHGSLRCDFVIIKQEPSHRRGAAFDRLVLRAHFFATFKFGPDRSTADPVSVAFGCPFSRRPLPVGRKQGKTLGRESDSKFCILRNTRTLTVVGLDALECATHAMPFYQGYEASRHAMERDVIDVECDMWLLNDVIDREVYHSHRAPGFVKSLCL